MIFIFVILIFTTKVQYLALFQSVYRTRKKNLPIFLCGDKTISELKNFRKKVFQCFTSVQCGRAWLQSLPWNIGLGIVGGDWRTKYCLFSLSVTHSCFHKLLSLTFEVYSGYIIANFQIFLTLHSYHSPSIIVSRPEPFTNTLEIESVEMSLQNTYCSSTLKSTPTAVLNCLTGNIWSLVILGFKDIPLILFFLAYNRNASSVEKSNFLVSVESNLTLSGAYRMSIERFSTSEMEK